MIKLILILLFALFSNCAVAADINSGLITWWTFNSNDISGTTVTDKSGSGNTGTASSGGLTSTPGILGQALSYTSTIFQGFVGGSNTINQSSATVSLWVYFTSLPATSTLAQIAGFQQGNLNATQDKDFFLDPSGNVYFYYFSTTAQCTSLPSKTASLNKWHLLTGTTSAASGAVMYLDGYPVGTNATNGSFAGYASANILVGGISSGSFTACGLGSPTRAYAPNGTKFNDMRIYNRTLSASEVLDLYNLGIGQHSHGF